MFWWRVGGVRGKGGGVTVHWFAFGSSIGVGFAAEINATPEIDQHLTTNSVHVPTPPNEVKV